MDANPESLSGPLKIPSEAYDMLRATLVQAELMLLRVLGFELKLPSPMDYLPKYLERAMEDFSDAGEDYEAWGKEYRAEYGVVEGGWMGTRLGKRASEMVVWAYVSTVSLDLQHNANMRVMLIQRNCIDAGIISSRISFPHAQSHLHVSTKHSRLRTSSSKKRWQNGLIRSQVAKSILRIWKKSF